MTRTLPTLVFRTLISVPALLLLAGLSAPLAGQTIAGTLVDDDTQDGVEGATVLLLGVAEDTLQSTLTDSLGHFAVGIPGVGAYYLEATRIGYGTTRSQSFNVTTADTTTVTFFVSTQAIVLDPIVVGIPTVIGSEVFEARRAVGDGLFFTPEMVDSLRPETHVGEIFESAGDDVFLTWGYGRREDGSYGPIPRMRSYRGASGCLSYIVDRTPVPDPFFSGVASPWGVAPLSELSPEDLVAIEIYRGWFEVPADYEDQILANTLGTRRKLRDMRRGECGIVVLWTERGWTGRRAPIP